MEFFGLGEFIKLMKIFGFLFELDFDMCYMVFVLLDWVFFVLLLEILEEFGNNKEIFCEMFLLYLVVGKIVIEIMKDNRKIIILDGL